MKIRREGEESAGLNLTSMIDCVFLLLIFFVATITPPKSEINIQAFLPREKTSGISATPSAEEEKKKEEANTVHITLRRGQGLEVLLNGALLEGGMTRLNAALATLRTLAAQTPTVKTDVVLDVDPEVPYHHVVRALELCSRHKFENVSFAMPSKEGAVAP